MTFAQPGSPDQEFGVGGKVRTDFGMGDDQGYSVAIEPDGRIVMAGTVTIGTGTDLGVARYTADGALDEGFGTLGKVTTDFDNGLDQAFSLALQPDGKILVAGTSFNNTNYDWVLVRYNTDGTLDDTFGDAGKVNTDFGSDFDIGRAVAVQADGKIVMAGHAMPGATLVDFALARYNTDGTLDPSFGAGGILTTDIGGGFNDASAVAIQPDGKIILAGAAMVGSTSDIALVRYDTDGTLDNSFNGNGIVTTDLGLTTDNARSIAIQTDGKILVTGYTVDNITVLIAVLRYNMDGTLDRSFDTDGVVTTGFGTGEDFGSAVAIQADGKVVVAGATDNDAALVRYTADGALDLTFGSAGLVTNPIGKSSGRSVAIQQDGKIIMAGSLGYGAASDLMVARFISDLSVGVVAFSWVGTVPLIYPNPIAGHATLEYTLQDAETISIQLLDMEGRTIHTFLAGQDQAAGEHRQDIVLSDALPAGAYLIAITSPKGRFTVQVVK